MTRNDTLRIAAPFMAMGGVWLAQKALRSGYQASTGHAPPTAEDVDDPFGRVLLFSIAAATLAAVVNAVVTRQVAKATRRAELPAE